jgi:hypothetical protein
MTTARVEAPSSVSSCCPRLIHADLRRGYCCHCQCSVGLPCIGRLDPLSQRDGARMCAIGSAERVVCPAMGTGCAGRDGSAAVSGQSRRVDSTSTPGGTQTTTRTLRTSGAAGACPRAPARPSYTPPRWPWWVLRSHTQCDTRRYSRLGVA